MSNKIAIEQLIEDSYLYGGNASYLEELYEVYLQDPQAVPEKWRECFDSFPKVNGITGKDASHAALREKFLALTKNSVRTVAAPSANTEQQADKQAHVIRLIDAYRSHGHHQAKLDPLHAGERQSTPDLDLDYHELGSEDLNTIFSTNSFKGTNSQNGKATLQAIHKGLEDTYTGSMGIEYMHITDTEQRKWIQNYFEPAAGKPDFDKKEKLEIFQELIAAEGLGKYLGRRFVGQKRFGLEGGESLIPMLQDMIQRAGAQDVKEVVLGMAHRGRLNVLVNVLGKAPKELFEEFEGKLPEHERSGDVKYHMGFSSDITTPGGVVHLALGFNPSHLEIISPVIEGSVRARQERRQDLERKQVLPISIHGDAAIAGQGVVMETFNMSQARGYSTGGTVHIVINNQIGFTTSNPLDARSTLYCTDVAKMVQAPVIHVNGDDPEAVVFASRLALDFRMKFKKDVVIDLVCYRRHGHNESDEPSGTQPLMYKIIRKLPTTLKVYSDKLINEGIVTTADVKRMEDDYRLALDEGKEVVTHLVKEHEPTEFTVNWEPYLDKAWDTPTNTGVALPTIKKLGKEILTIPKDFVLQAQVKKEFENREKMIAGENPIHWGLAESLAYASLLNEGYHIRLSGQDSGRGTFAHRHAVLHHYEDGSLYVPLANINNAKGRFTVIDSVLTEEAVVAFEYGFASADPQTLVIWEAQFGDFANGAQVVIDQFISSGDQKWGRLCGLVMFLPHGYEGMGPEHSSARLERFLQLCAQHNMQVCVPSTPSQVYHMIRRQMVRPFRKPLIVMTPKSLLRHKLAVSTLADLATGEFKLVIPEIDPINHNDVKRIILCSGKVYYDLLQTRRETGQSDTAIIRIEQLYPFPEEQLQAELEQYPNAKELVWCQEEPKNQGAWYSIYHHLRACFGDIKEVEYAGRKDSAAPAVGYLSLHLEEQKALVADALGNK